MPLLPEDRGIGPDPIYKSRKPPIPASPVPKPALPPPPQTGGGGLNPGTTVPKEDRGGLPSPPPYTPGSAPVYAPQPLPTYDQFPGAGGGDPLPVSPLPSPPTPPPPPSGGGGYGTGGGDPPPAIGPPPVMDRPLPPPRPPAPPTSRQQATDMSGDVRNQWDTITRSFQDSLGRELQDVDLQTSLNARRANEMNALLGGSAMGGGAAAGQAQAQLGGMALRSNVISDNSKRAFQARQAYLQMSMDRLAQMERLAATEEEAARYREMQLKLQQLANEGAVAAAEATGP